MPFWKKKPQKADLPPQQSKQQIVIMKSDTLGMTVIEQDMTTTTQIEQISPEEWVDILDQQKLNGVPFKRIYFSFLKGIPTYLRMKIWLLLCTQNNFKHFQFTGKFQEEYESKKEVSIKELSLQVYKKLATVQPKDKQVEQIQKDIKRTYSYKLSYKYTTPLLRKLLYALSNSGIEYSQGMNYILLNIIVYCLESIGLTEESFHLLQPQHQRDMFIIYRETVVRLEEVFGGAKIFKIMKDLQQKIAESVPEILFIIYNLGMDCFSIFSQNYYSVMSYNDPPEELCKQMMDLFYLVGEKAIHATIVKMLQISQKDICKIKSPQNLQSYLKKDIYTNYYSNFVKEKVNAKKLEDFGMCFFQNVQKLQVD